MTKLKVNHIGYAVKSIDAAIAHYQTLFDVSVSGREVLTSRGIEIAFLDGENTRIELLQSLEENTPLHRFIEKRGEGLHHVCYEVSDIKSELARIKALGFELIDPVPRPGAHGTMIAFVHPQNFFGVLTEFCEILF